MPWLRSHSQVPVFFLILWEIASVMDAMFATKGLGTDRFTWSTNWSTGAATCDPGKTRHHPGTRAIPSLKAATLGTNSIFKGNILTDQSLTLTTGPTLDCKVYTYILT
jgi:hypothetical protein